MDQEQLNKAMERREEIGFELIEADQETRQALELELSDIEQNLELSTGQSIEQLETAFYGREYNG